MKKKLIDWKGISNNQKLSFNFIKQYKNKLDWEKLCLNKKIELNIKLIREFQDIIDWNYISKNKNYISKFKKLDEKFIIEFQDKLNWFYILCINKNLIFSKKFICNFINKLDFITHDNLCRYYPHIFGYYSEIRYKKQIDDCFEKLIKILKNEVIVKYIFNSLGDIGFIINSYINYDKNIFK